MPENDKYYIKRCLDGHPDDFRHLIRRYQGVLLAHLAGHLSSRDWAEEALQETFVRCYFNLSKLKKAESFFSWMLGTGNRVAKEQLRSEKRHRDAVKSLSEAEPTRQSGPCHDFPLARTIARLDGSQRELILLRYYGGHSCSQIAGQLDMPIGTVTKTLSRAYARLRELLGQEEKNQQSEVQK